MTKNTLVDFLGNYPRVRIGCLLLENPEAEYTMQQIMEKAEGDSDIYALINDLVMDGYVKENKEKDAYRINTENELIKKLLKSNCGNGSNK